MSYLSSDRRRHPLRLILPLLALAGLFWTSPLEAQDPSQATIEGILQQYSQKVRAAGFGEMLGPQVDSAGSPELNAAQAEILSSLAKQFFLELARNQLTMDHVERAKRGMRDKHPSPGEVGESVGQAWWDANFLTIERALMLGRAKMVQGCWEATLQQYLDDVGPDAFATLYGEGDIGSDRGLTTLSCSICTTYSDPEGQKVRLER